MTTSSTSCSRGRDAGVLATIKRDGRPHLSNVNYTYDRVAAHDPGLDHRPPAEDGQPAPRPAGQLRGHHARTSAGTWWPRAGVRCPRWPPTLNDDAVDELVDIYRRIAGEHPDWAEFRAAMVADQRIALTLHVERLYGWPRS